MNLPNWLNDLCERGATDEDSEMSLQNVRPQGSSKPWGGRPSHGEVVQANGIDTRPYLLRAEEQGRGIVKKAVHPYGWTSHPHSDILSLPKVEQTR
nr:hypothetical protein CFP56_29077 [Quercus suber]